MVCGDNERFNPLRDIEQKYKCELLKWNSPCGCLTSRSDIENLKFGAKAACLQPGFHLPFVYFGNFASADFLLLICTALIKEFRRNAKGSIGKLILTGAHELQSFLWTKRKIVRNQLTLQIEA